MPERDTISGAVIHANADAGSAPFCHECGYDLHGLPLPHACPECGRFCDPSADAVEARAWFASRRSAWRWLLRPRSVPTSSLFALGDAESREVARRREFCWLWLPALIAMGSAILGPMVCVEYNVKVSYHDATDPRRTVLRTVDNNNEVDRLFALNWHMFRGGIFFQKPPSWVETVTREPSRVTLAIPEHLREPEPFIAFLGLAPLLAVVCGYLLLRQLLGSSAARRAGERSTHDDATSVRTAAALLAAPLGGVLWLYLLMSYLASVVGLLTSADDGLLVATIPVMIGVGLWLGVAAWAIASFLRLDRTGLLFTRRLVLWAVCVVLVLGLPAGAFIAVLGLMHSVMS